VKALVVIVCLAGSGALWFWALTTPKPVEPLDAKYCGAFELFRYESVEGETGDDPIARGEHRVYTIGADHLYTMRMMGKRNFELGRESGVILAETTPEGREFLVFTLHTVNMTLEPAEPERYLAEWGSDDDGRYLHLTRELEDGSGPQLFLRRVRE